MGKLDASGAGLLLASLLYYEVTNGLYRYQKANYFTIEAVKKALTAALMLPIDLVSNSDLHVRAKIWQLKFNLPATYDAHYLAGRVDGY
ncbi:MAG: type II toxin-antitoxin system VapC family toxin [Anaerolineales bacterium]